LGELADDAAANQRPGHNAERTGGSDDAPRVLASSQGQLHGLDDQNDHEFGGEQ
jgi:hypothetical protein